MLKDSNSKPKSSPALPDDKPLEKLAEDPLESLPFAPPGLKSPMAALATRMTRPETLALIDRQIAKRRTKFDLLG
jgi:hypothetical protein